MALRPVTGAADRKNTKATNREVAAFLVFILNAQLPWRRPGTRPIDGYERSGALVAELSTPRHPPVNFTAGQPAGAHRVLPASASIHGGVTAGVRSPRITPNRKATATPHSHHPVRTAGRQFSKTRGTGSSYSLLGPMRLETAPLRRASATVTDRLTDSSGSTSSTGAPGRGRRFSP